ncbi:MAG: hypothetical protein V2I36_14675, partial [Desulfopila sp.]|nr:hypothetical protein [Desulfopila sp.]
SLAADIISGPNSSWPRSFIVFNGALYFNATYDNSVPEGNGDGFYRYGEILSSQFSWNLFLPAILSADRN